MDTVFINILFILYSDQIIIYIINHLTMQAKEKKIQPELKTLEWDILNPDRIINLEIKNERRTSNI